MLPNYPANQHYPSLLKIVEYTWSPYFWESRRLYPGPGTLLCLPLYKMRFLRFWSRPQFGTTITQVEVTVHKIKVIAILNTGSLVNVISS